MATDHGQQALGNQQRHEDVHGEKQHDRAHRQKMNAPGGVEIAEQSGQFLELDRLSDRQSRKHDDNASGDDAGIKEPLHGIVDGEVRVTEAAGQGREHVAQHVFRPDREQLAAKMPRGQPIRQIDKAVGGDDPHGREMPLQRPGQGPTQRDRAGKLERQSRIRVVDLPAAENHHHHCSRIDPMGEAHDQWMDWARLCPTAQVA